MVACFFVGPLRYFYTIIVTKQKSIALILIPIRSPFLDFIMLINIDFIMELCVRMVIGCSAAFYNCPMCLYFFHFS